MSIKTWIFGEPAKFKVGDKVLTNNMKIVEIEAVRYRETWQSDGYEYLVKPDYEERVWREEKALVAKLNKALRDYLDNLHRGFRNLKECHQRLSSDFENLKIEYNRHVKEQGEFNDKVSELLVDFDSKLKSR